jgi:hypothetical protein
MRTFVHALVTMATFTLGSVALADSKILVITGRIVERNDVGIVVQGGKKRLEINTQDIKYTGKLKIGDTVTVHYTTGNHVYRFDPDNIATSIEVKLGLH